MKDSIFPMHPSQRDVYFDQLINPDSPQYNIGGYVRLKGFLDPEKFRLALGSSPAVFDAFRLRFDLTSSEPVYYLQSDFIKLDFEEVDYSSFENPSQQALSFVQERLNTPFVLRKDNTPFELVLIKVSPDEHWLLCRFHHLMSDGYSFPLWISYLARSYKSLVTGDVIDFIYPSYVEESVKAFEYYNSPDYELEGKYWKEKISKKPQKVLSRQNHRQGDIYTNKSSTFILDITEQQRQKLEELQLLFKVGLPQLTIAALLIYFGKTTDLKEFVFGIPLHKRSSKRARNTFGMFSGFLPFKAIFDNDLVLSDFIKEITLTQRKDYRYQNYLIGDLSRQLQVNPSEGYLTDIIVNYEPLGFEADFGDLLQGTIMRMSNEYEVNPLQLVWREYNRNRPLQLHIHYRTEYFFDKEIELLAQRLLFIINQFSADQTVNLGSIDILPFPERQELLDLSGGGPVGYEANQTVAGLFCAQVLRSPGAVALVQGDREISYGQLWEMSSSLAAYLRVRGVVPGELVGVCIERSIEMVAGIMAVLQAGGTYVPIDPQYPAGRVEYLLQDSAARVVLTQRSLAAMFSPAQGGQREIICVDGYEAPQEGLAPQEVPAGNGQEVCIIYTSGSTGRPKGVKISNAGLLNRLFWMWEAYPFGEAEVSALKTSVGFVDHLWELFGPLLAGVPSVVVSREEAADLDRLVAKLRAAQVTRLVLVPSLLRVLLHKVQEEGLVAGGSLGRIKYWSCSGEVLGAELVNLFYALFPGGGNRLLNIYGSSEVTADVTFYDTWAAGKYVSGAAVPVGRPLPGCVVYILDSFGQLLPWGVAGEICVGGVQVAVGYLNQAQLSEQKFRRDTYSSRAGARLYRTGDIGRWDREGNLQYIGRLDGQVKIRGNRIEPAEIEGVSVQSGLVEQAAVVVQRQQQQEGSSILVGYATVAAGKVLDKEGLLHYLRSRLPGYMVPAVWVEVEAMPLTAGGKTDKSLLPCVDMRELSSGVSDGARSATEVRVAGIWERLLGVERLGMGDNFFELGGHSLLAMRVVSSVRREFGVDIGIKALFEYPQAGELSAYVDRVLQGAGAAGARAAGVIGVQERGERIPLSFSQERLWFIDRLEGSVQYHLPAVLRLRGSLNKEGLEFAFSALIERHEVLRTVCVEQEGQGSQQVKQQGDWRLSFLDRKEYKGDETGLANYIQQLVSHPFDLSKDYMLRAFLVQLDELEHLLIVIIHHIAADGWSFSVIVREIAELYSSYEQGRAAVLPVLPLQYADYSIWQRKFLQGEVLDKKIGYWKEKLADVAALQLPTDYNRPAVQGINGASVSFGIGKETTVRLQELSRRQGVTLFMTLLAVFKVLLSRYSSQQDICVGTAIAGRQSEELENLIGFFVNILALRDNVNAEMPFTGLLQQVKVTTLEAYAHQEVPFEKVVEAVVKERDQSRSPLFQVMLVLQDMSFNSELIFDKINFSLEEVLNKYTKFELIINIKEEVNGLQIIVQYSTDLYRRDTIDRMTDHFKQLLNSSVQNPDEKVGLLKMLTKKEEQQLLKEFNDSQIEYPQNKSIADLFEEQVKKTPDNIAVIYNGEKLTYNKLNIRANEIGHCLLEKGVKPEQLIPICSERSLGMIAGILGILKAGAAYVPIDPEYPLERIKYMLEDSASEIVVSSVECRSRLTMAKAVDVILTDGSDKAHFNTKKLDQHFDLKLNINPSQLAYVIYTSGSTGKSKGVLIEHKSVIDHCYGIIMSANLERCKSFALSAPLVFDAGHSIIFSSLLLGATLHVLSAEILVDGIMLGAYLRNNKIDYFKMVPSLWLSFANEGELLLPLKVMMFGGEAFTANILTYLKNSGFKGEVYNHYGPTETAIGKCIFELDLNCQYQQVPIGKAYSNANLYIVDSFMQLVPVGLAGELCIGGDGLARGYLNQPELTKEKFIKNPFSAKHEKIYKTGDFCRWLADGNIEYLGRIDEQVKIRGYRIELGEIENVVLQSNLVQQVAIIVKKDQKGDSKLIGYLVVDEDFNKQILIYYLAAKLPKYMIPSVWVAMEVLPLTINGKTDKSLLPCVDMRELSSGVSDGARSATEVRVAGIWERLLGVERLGMGDNFFELGGHSLLAMRVVSSVRREFGVDIGIKALFEYPQAGELSAYVDRVLQGAGAAGARAAGVIGVQERGERIPLSFSQERLWFIDRLEGSVQYHLPAVLRLRGSLNKEGLEFAFSALIERHEVLRTVCVEQEGQGSQQVKQQGDWRLGTTGAYRHDRQGLHSHIEDFIRRPFNLMQDYMLRAELLQLEEQEYILAVTLHHIAADAWSLPLIVREIAELYSSYEQGRAAVLPVLPLQYADYSIWQRKFLQGEVLDKKISYWKEKLADVAALQLPTDYNRPAVQGIKGASVSFGIGKETTVRLQELSRRQGVTLFMTLLAVFKVLLSRYSSQQDICVGTSVANRSHQEIEGLAGFFVNTLAFRDEVSAEMPFTGLLEQVKVTTLEAYAHQEVPFEKVVEAVVKERDQSRSPLFQVMLVLANTPGVAQLQLGEVDLTPEPYTSGVSKFELTFFLTETPSGLQGLAEFRTDLYAPETISRMSAHYRELLCSVVSDPARQVGLLQMLTKEEEHQLLQEFNELYAEYPRHRSVAELFEEQAVRTPQNTAVVYEGEALTYGELNIRANRLAHYLRSKGAGKGQLIPLCLEPGLPMVAALLGILKAGCAYVPLDMDFPVERLRYMLQDTAATLVVSSSEARFRLPPEMQGSVTVIEADTEVMLNIQPRSNPLPQAGPGDLAYVIYTSGSTGLPKGVMITHGSLADYVYGLQQRVNIGQSASFALVSTIATDLGNTVLYGSLLSGGALHVFSRASVSDSGYLQRYFRVEQIDCLKIVPSHWQALSAGGQLLLPRRLLIFGGEALRSEAAVQILHAAPACRVVNHYGPTETTIGKLLHEVREDYPYGATIPVGRPFSNTQVYVCSEQLQVCPVGVPGQLYIAGAGLAQGYLHNEALSSQKFLRNPFGPAGSLMYATGDLVKYLPDGNIEFIGRIDGQVKIRGYRVELGEIERSIEQSGLVRQAVVTAPQDRQGNRRLVGYVVGKEPVDAFDKEALMAYLQQKLPEYMLPALWVELAHLPLTANGKTDRRALPDPAVAETPPAAYTPPRNETEQALAEIWQDILETGQVSIHEDFFVLGGHSLLAIRVVSAIRKALQAELAVSDIFDYPTIAQLSVHLEQGRQEDKSPLLPAVSVVRPRPGRVPLSFSQERLWFIDRLEGSVPYHVPSVLRLSGEVDTAVLEQALREVVRRHEALRTVFIEEEGEVWQQVRAAEAWELVRVEGRHYSEEELQGYVEKVIGAPYDLSADYMLRATLIRTAERQYVLAATLHHIASDGWSRSVMVKELVELYSSLCGGRAARLAALPVQYADYALWQRGYLQGGVLQQKLGYWKEKLAGVAALQLPADYARPPVWSRRGGWQSFEIGRQLSERLQELSVERGATLFMTLLAVFKVLLSRYSGQQDICVGTPAAGRQQQELEGLIGFFVNTLALRSQVRGEERFSELLGQLKATTLEAYQHQEVPFEKVVEAVVRERDAGRSPLFQVMLVLRNTPEVPELRLGAAELRVEGHVHSTSMFDLTLYITQTEQGLRCGLEYSTELYAAATIERLAVHYGELLRSVAANPLQRVGELEMLSAGERQELLDLSGGGPVGYEANQTVAGLFCAQVLRSPGAVALVQGDREISYGQLWEMSSSLAAYLRVRGVVPGELVGVCIERSIEMVAGIMAVLQAGGTYVPIDPQYPAGRVEYLLQDSAARVVLTQRSLAAMFSPAQGGQREIICVDGYEAPQEGLAPQEVPAGNGQEVCIIYTSGSTGRPKGVKISNAGLLNRLFWMWEAYPFGEAEVSALKTSVGFVDHLWELFGPLLAGVPSVVVSREEAADLDRLVAKLRAAQVTRLVLVPSLLRVLLHKVQEEGLVAGGSLGRIKYWSCSGEVLGAELVNLFYALFPGGGNRLLNIYGSSEVTADVTFYDTWAAGKYVSGAAVPVGRPLPGCVVYILDSFGQLLPWGVAGEICVGGVQVAVGYLNQAQLSEQKFRRDTYSSRAGARLYRTGDIGRWDREGNLQYIGRLDGQVKIRGNRIEPAEIEGVSVQSGLVEQAAVVVQRQQQQEEGSSILVGYATVAAGKVLDKEGLLHYLRSRLPGYMVPAVWVEVEAMPLTAGGKTDKSLLPCVDMRELSSGVSDGARSATEVRVAGIWERLLGVERLGMGDNFFELGGHSLLAMRVVSSVRREFGVDIGIKALFEYPQAGELSAYVDRVLQGAGAAGARAAGVIGVQERGERIPLSFSQERLWFIDRLEGSVQYHLPAVLRLRGSLNKEGLSYALKQIIGNNEVLRTIYLDQDGIVYQNIISEEKWQLSFVEIDKQNNKDIENYIRQVISKPFNLSKDYMLRSSLLQINEQEHLLVVTIHHIAADAWSLSIIVREIATLYNSYNVNQLKPIPSKLKYADYAIWQRNYLKGEILDKKLGYWKIKLQNLETLQLPTDYTRQSIKSTQGAVSRFNIEKGSIKKLQDLSKKTDATLFMVLLAAFKVLLHRYTGQQDICIGTSNANRKQQELEDVVGFFVNILALRTEVKGEDTFRELLHKVKETAVEAYEHEDVPFEKVVDEIVKERDRSRSPLVQVMFIMLDLPDSSEINLGDLIISREANEHTTAQFDISFYLFNSSEGWKGTVEYSTDLFRTATIKRMIEHFKELIFSVTETPDQKVSLLSIQSIAEQNQLLYQCSGAKTDYPENKTIPDLFAEQVKTCPKAIAVSFEEKQISYEHLNECSNRLAHLLLNLGVNTSTLVPVCIERSIDLIVGILGILKAGGAYVPIDPGYPQERINYILQETEATIIVAGKETRKKLVVSDLIRIIELDNDSSLINFPVQAPQTTIYPENLAYVIYTSGSTGIPKGVLVEHRNVISLVKGTDYVSLTNRDILLSTGSPSFDATTLEFWGMLLNGGRLILCPENTLLDSKLLKAEIKKRNVNKMWFTSGWFNQLVDNQIDVFAELQTVLVGGEKLSPRHIEQARQRYPDLEIINGYGPTENTTFSLTYKISETKFDSSVPVGRPLSNRTAYILDKQHQLVSVGVAGEICVGGAGLARGYLKNPQLTEDKFIANPFKEGSRLYKTGDLGRWLPDGNIEYLGRMDSQVKIRGYRIELGEIESVLLQSGLVRQVMVLAREDKEGSKRLAGYVVPEGFFGKENIINYLRERLPEFMVPGLWIELDSFPLTSNGKIDTRALPVPEAEAITSEFIAPRNEVETGMAEIWKELLGIEQLGVEDNFFELGGDSIITIQLVSRLRRLGYDIQVADVFTYQTIGGLAKIITTNSEADNTDDQSVLTGESGLLPVQQWYFEKASAFISHFNQSVFLHIDKSITLQVLQLAFEQLISHHDALRFRFYNNEGTWHQEYGSFQSAVVNEDLQLTEQELLKAEIEKAAAGYQQSLDIQKGDVIRLVRMQTPASESTDRLLIIIHHLVIDGVSWRILLEDLELLIDGLIKNEEVSLGKKTSSYPKWYAALQQYSHSRTLLSQKEYWQKVSGNYSPLPADYEYAGQIKAKDTKNYLIHLDNHTTRQLLQEVPAAYHTEINDILLCALAITLCSHSGSKKVVIGLEGHGRQNIEPGIDTSRTVGWFTTLYPVLLQADEAVQPGDWIKAIKEQLRQVPDKGLGYGVLRYMNKEETLIGRHPWDIVFNYFGQLDNVVNKSRWMVEAHESAGPVRNGEYVPDEKISVNGSVQSGELLLSWSYSGKHYRQDTIEKLAEEYLTNLKMLITHCLQQQQSGSTVHTPSDYGLGTDVSYQELDRFLEEEEDMDNILSF